MDRHPRARIKRMLFPHRAILDLCPDESAKERMRALLEPKKRLRPHEAHGMTEQEFIKQGYHDLTRIQSMSLEERQKMVEKYRRLRNPEANAIEMLTGILGIKEYWQMYSDFDQDELP